MSESQDDKVAHDENNFFHIHEILNLKHINESRNRINKSPNYIVDKFISILGWKTPITFIMVNDNCEILFVLTFQPHKLQYCYSASTKSPTKIHGSFKAPKTSFDIIKQGIKKGQWIRFKIRITKLMQTCINNTKLTSNNNEILYKLEIFMSNRYFHLFGYYQRTLKGKMINECELSVSWYGDEGQKFFKNGCQYIHIDY